MKKEVSPDLHEERVKKIIKKGVAEMRSGKRVVFPMSQLIEEETNHLQAVEDARKRKRHKKEAPS